MRFKFNGQPSKLRHLIGQSRELFMAVTRMGAHMILIYIAFGMQHTSRTPLSVDCSKSPSNTTVENKLDIKKTGAQISPVLGADKR